jgi:hypothetical protein
MKIVKKLITFWRSTLGQSKEDLLERIIALEIKLNKLEKIIDLDYKNRQPIWPSIPCVTQPSHPVTSPYTISCVDNTSVNAQIRVPNHSMSEMVV